MHLCEDDNHKQGVGQVWENLPNLNHLNALNVYGFPDIPTSANAFPSNLTKLAISCTNLNDYVMNTLGSLTNLRILKLRDCSSRSAEFKLCCISGFPKLAVFKMRRLDLYCWELSKDVMPCLICLNIEECYLTALPDKLWSLTSLREVQVKGYSTQSMRKQLQSQPMRNGCNIIIEGSSKQTIGFALWGSRER